MKLEIRNIQRFAIVFSFLLLTFGSFAQQRETVDGRDFYIHEVEQGSTLYSIARQYNIRVADIQTENPFLDAGLQPGQTLRIPIDKIENKTQTAEADTTVPDGYKAHIVEQGETLYALSRKYQVTVKEILDKNPNVINGLKLGQRVLIPATPTKTEKKSSQSVQVDESKYIRHKVEQGQTLYSLSRQYEIPADSLMKLNDGLPNGLQVGMELIIPKIKPAEVLVVKEVVGTVDTLVLNDSTVRRNIYNVALMLPFYLDTNQAMEEVKREFDKDQIYPKSAIALQFYQGALLAVDSMRKQGLSVKLYVYDTEEDTMVVKGILNRPEMKSMNLFIGPLYKENFMIVADYAKKNRIGIVSPVPQSNKILLGNPYVSKVSPSRVVQVEKLARFVVSHHANDNLFVFNNYEGKGIALVDHFHKIASQELDSMKNAPMDSIKEVYFASIKAKSMQVLLDSTKKNVIVIPSNDQAFVSEFLTQLNLLSEDYDITVYGLDKWKNFDNINTEYLHNLKVHITAPYVMSYEANDEKTLMRKFRKNYSTDPNQFGFTGFDVTYYYLGMLGKYGANYQAHLPEYPFKGVITSFDYYQTSMESGFENQSAHILRYQDFGLVEVE